MTHLLCLVRPMDDATFLEALTFENLDRLNLQPMEEARGYANLMKKIEGWTVERIAERSKKSPDYVRDRLRLLKLVPAAVSLLEEGTIPLTHALELAKLAPDDQHAVIEEGLFANASAQRSHLPQFDKLLEAQPEQKPVSLAELKHWIDEHVRFNLATQPDLEHLLPETARNVARAQAEKLPVVPIALGYIQPEIRGKEKVLSRGMWERADGQAGSKTCEYARKIGYVPGGDAARGQSWLICTAREKCKVHFAARVKQVEQREKAKRGELTDKKGAKVSEAALVQKQREKEAKEKAAREARRKAFAAAAPEVLDALFAAAKKANPVALVRQLGFRFDNALIKKRASALPTKTAEDLLRLVFVQDSLGGVWNATDEWAFDRTYKSMAKLLGVDLEAIVKKHTATPPKVEPAKPVAPNVPVAVQKKHAKVVAKLKATGKTVKVRPSTQFMKPVTPDATLAAIVGAKPLTRTELTKKLWAYIKKNGLQDKKNRRMINADEKLKALFGGKAQVSMFDMTKIVGKHLVKGQGA
jgi:chromatin remodeling complex protein RSC6